MRLMNIKFMLAFSISTINASEIPFSSNYQKTIKFLFDYKKTQLLIKVGLNIASVKEVQTAFEIASQEFERSTKAINRAEAKITEIVKVFVAKDHDIEVLLSTVAAVNKQLGQFLEDQLTLLRPVANVDLFKAIYGSISRKRDKLKSLEIDPSPLVSVLFKKIAKKELCIQELTAQFKDLFIKLRSDRTSTGLLNQLARLTVLISMLEDTNKALIELQGKDMEALWGMAEEIYKNICSTQELSVPQSRKFLCKEKDWKTIKEQSSTTAKIVEDFLENWKQQGYDCQEEWIVALHFFAKGLTILSTETRELIERDHLLKRLLIGFKREDLMCFKRFNTSTLSFQGYLRRSFTTVFRMFFDIIHAIGIEGEVLGALSQSSSLLGGQNPISENARTLRQGVSIFVKGSCFRAREDDSVSSTDLHSSIPALPSIRIGKVGLPDEQTFSRSCNNLVNENNIGQEVLNGIFQAKKLYEKLTNLTKAAILDYFSGHKNIDFLRYKTRILAHTYLHNMRGFLGRYSSIKACGCLKQEFDALESYIRKFQFASENTCEFLAEEFKRNILSTLDFYRHKENLVYSYSEYKKAYGEVTVGKLLSLQQEVFSSVLYVRAIINPELVFYETQSKQKESFLKMAGQFCSGMYGQ